MAIDPDLKFLLTLWSSKNTITTGTITNNKYKGPVSSGQAAIRLL